MKEKHITRVSADKLKRMKSKTDWKRVDTLTEAEIGRAAAGDPEASLTTAADWADARVIWPQAKEPVTLRLDKNVLAWFRRHGQRLRWRQGGICGYTPDAARCLCSPNGKFRSQVYKS